MVIYDKIYLEAFINIQYTAELRLNFSSIPRMALIFTNFQQEVGMNHVQCYKAVNIRGIPK